MYIIEGHAARSIAGGLVGRLLVLLKELVGPMYRPKARSGQKASDTITYCNVFDDLIL